MGIWPSNYGDFFPWLVGYRPATSRMAKLEPGSLDPSFISGVQNWVNLCLFRFRSYIIVWFARIHDGGLLVCGIETDEDCQPVRETIPDEIRLSSSELSGFGLWIAQQSSLSAAKKYGDSSHQHGEFPWPLCFLHTDHLLGLPKFTKKWCLTPPKWGNRTEPETSRQPLVKDGWLYIHCQLGFLGVLFYHEDRPYNLWIVELPRSSSIHKRSQDCTYCTEKATNLSNLPLSHSVFLSLSMST